jgi:hypothetical protein
MSYKKPKRMFEDAGLVDPRSAYHVDLERVVNTKNHDLKTMVDRGRYFSIFAPRQSGKTTFFEGFCADIKKDPAYVPILLSFQDSRRLDKATFYGLIQEAICEQLLERLEEIHCENLVVVRDLLNTHYISDHISFRKLFEELNRLLELKKILIFIDEFDGIPENELENFLTTLRELYQKYKKRKDKALYSVGLVGIRNITKLIVGGVSPFNIADQVKLPPFSLKNVRDLYAQYSEETNQPFTDEAVKTVYTETAGQPWLVNRLGTILTVEIKPETTEPITVEDVESAIKRLLRERNSHFDNLLEKARMYKESFVTVIFNGIEYNPDDEDQSWLEQFGLIKEENEKVEAANTIYKRRFLKAFFQQSGAVADTSLKSYFTQHGLLDMEPILSDFEEYIIQIGVNAFYAGKKPYEKTGQFLLTAWLYQFVEGGKGDLRFETPTGLGRMDILLTYGGRKYIVETKINRSNIHKTLEKAIDQLCEKYLLTEQSDEGCIVVFDIKTKVGELCTPRRREVAGKQVLIFSIAIGR